MCANETVVFVVVVVVVVVVAVVVVVVVVAAVVVVLVDVLFGHLKTLRPPKPRCLSVGWTDGQTWTEERSDG